MTLHGTARAVTHSAAGGPGQSGTLSFHLMPDGPTNNLPVPVPVQISAELEAGRLSEGDEVDVSGVWDGHTLDADEVGIVPSGTPPQRRSSPPGTTARWETETASPRSRARWAVLAALVAVILVVAGAVVWSTDGFGRWTRPGPILTPASVTVFAPDSAPDNPQRADLAIDGDPDTSWSTVTYRDAVPFPNFIEGQGLMLHLSEPAALSAVTIELSSTGTEVQIRSSPTETPASLADTSELTSATTLQPGENRIEVDDATETSNVLVWISTLGTTDGQSRTEISEITLQAR